jgi:hypothetical protein
VQTRLTVSGALEGFVKEGGSQLTGVLTCGSWMNRNKKPSHKEYTVCPRRNVPDFGRVFLMLKYTDITQNTYVQS